MSENWSSIMNAPLIKTELPGPKSSELIKIQNNLETSSRSYTRFFKIALDYGMGSTVVDVDGNIFIDWFGGVSVMNLGHGNPLILNAITRQLQKITHITEIPTEARIDFLKTLNATLPKGLKDRSKVLFTVTGGDACEAAVSLAKYQSKRNTIITFSGSYHGVAGGIVNATANNHYREYAGFENSSFFHVPFPYTYRFPWKVDKDDISKAVVDYVEYLIKDNYSGISPVGGILVEPIQGEGGYIVPPDDFLPMLREISSKYSIPLIIDEVQSGVGRTGKIWAIENYNVDPDIMCISKSIGGGIPISAIVYKEDYDNIPTSFHLGTYRGNPLGLAAGSAILKYLQESNILSTVRKRGEIIKKNFEEIGEKNRIIGEVRGKGFMIGVELNSDENKTPGTKEANDVREKMFKKGVLMHTCGHYSNVMRFMSPLNIEDELLEKGIKIFEESIKEVSGRK